MSDEIIRPDGRPVPKTLTTVAKIRHCGDCRHAKLLPQANGQLDISMRTCLQGPPQLFPEPRFVQGPPRPVPGVLGQATAGPPVLIGFQIISMYPPVNVRNIACSRFEEKTADDRAIEEIDKADIESDGSLARQRKN